MLMGKNATVMLQHSFLLNQLGAEMQQGESAERWHERKDTWCVRE